jgi:hypothetical protein
VGGPAKKTIKKPGEKGGGGKPRSSKPSVGNTASFPYLDSKTTKKPCAKEKNDIEEKCKPESDDVKAKRLQGEGGLLSKLKLPKKSGGGKKGAEWIGDHCEFLMLKPGSADDMFAELQNLPQQLAEQLGTKALEAVEEKATKALTHAVEKKLAKMGLKQLIPRVGSFFLGPWTGVAVNVAMTADGAHDLVKAAEEFPELKKEMENAKKALAEAKQKVSDLQSQLDKYKDEKGNLKKDALISDTMQVAARTNDCITARRCQLVPYNQTGTAAAMNGKGCCPGQTGHHLLPEAMFDHCKNYGPAQHANAPTICVEGATNRHGSHGAAHEKLHTVLENKHPNIPFGSTMPKKDAINAGVEAARDAFPEARCSEECLKAQLEDFYKKLNCKPHKESGLPKKKDGEGSTF